MDGKNYEHFWGSGLVFTKYIICAQTYEEFAAVSLIFDKTNN